MQQHYLDEGVFIRSMATRGSHGGLPESTSNVIKLLNAFGKDIILVETVGVGQTELDIMRNADTTIVVLTPESGDTIQTMKAGLFEIADIFAVNKSDRPGSDNMIAELRNMISLHSNQDTWLTPVTATEAVNNVGIEELYGYIVNHRKILEETGQLAQRRRQQRRQEFVETIQRSIKDRLLTIIQHDKVLSKYIDLVENAEIDPYTAANKVLQSAKLSTDWARQSTGKTTKKT
jgi:LAO/AO transport system kinase